VDHIKSGARSRIRMTTQSVQIAPDFTANDQRPLALWAEATNRQQAGLREGLRQCARALDRGHW